MEVLRTSAMSASSRAMFTDESCIRDYHVYKDILDSLNWRRARRCKESDNAMDLCAAVMMKPTKHTCSMDNVKAIMCVAIEARNYHSLQYYWSYTMFDRFSTRKTDTTLHTIFFRRL